MTRRRRVALLFAGWLAFGIWQPTLGGILFTVVLGLAGLRLIVGGYRRVHGWVSQ